VKVAVERAVGNWPLGAGKRFFSGQLTRSQRPAALNGTNAQEARSTINDFIRRIYGIKTR
jgi:hypothetical protein